jgi:hypothetical protein
VIVEPRAARSVEGVKTSWNERRASDGRDSCSSSELFSLARSLGFKSSERADPSVLALYTSTEPSASSKSRGAGGTVLPAPRAFTRCAMALVPRSSGSMAACGSLPALCSASRRIRSIACARSTMGSTATMPASPFIV